MEQQTQQQAAPETQAPPPEQKKLDRVQTLLDGAIDEAMRRQVQAFALRQCDFEQNQRIAHMMYAAGLYDDLKGKTAEQGRALAMIKIELGRTMGIEPFEAMNSIYFVHGRPSLESGVRAARMRRFGYDWKMIQHDDKGCRMLLLKDGKYLMQPVLDADGNVEMEERNGEMVVKERPVVVGFTEPDAIRANLLQKNGSLYKVWPKLMYFYRAISIAQKVHAPEVLNGAELPSPEEAESMPAFELEKQQPTEGTMEAALDIAAQKLAKMQQEPEPDIDDEPVVSEKPKSEKPAPVSANPGTLFQGGLGRR